MNMNVVLHIKKKWVALRALRVLAAVTAAVMAEGMVESAELEDFEDYDEDFASFNAPVRNKFIMPLKVLDKIPYT